MDSTHHYFKKYSKGELPTELVSGDLTENPSKTIPILEPTTLSPLVIHRSMSTQARESQVLAFLFGQTERLNRLYE